jgi:hypothetical protein
MVSCRRGPDLLVMAAQFRQGSAPRGACLFTGAATPRHRHPSAQLAARHRLPALRRRHLEAPVLSDETDSIEQAITLLDTHPTESIMSLQTTLFSAVAAAALALSAVAAQAAPQEVVKLPRVVITAKSAPQVVQLPRVVVTGYSEATLARQALAAAKANVKRS